eukprot:maker-scaffold_6-snap-gene-10.1-mRNA-1 protein AED:0.34 eAED:0.34 QI:53/1/1/1/1/1/2/156/115
MTVKYIQTLDNGRLVIYSCRSCGCELAYSKDVISKTFNGRTGKAYLFDRIYNYKRGPTEKKELMTGLHECADVYCTNCRAHVGWTYDKAYDEEQKYKIDKFVLEKALIKLVKTTQ